MQLLQGYTRLNFEVEVNSFELDHLACLYQRKVYEAAPVATRYTGHMQTRLDHLATESDPTLDIDCLVDYMV